MKINWGTKLAFFAILFMVFVVSMVVVISRQDMPLVEDDYYEKGLNYQKEIDNNANMDSLITMDIVRIGNGPIEGDISLAIEKKSLGKIEEAELYFYRPSDPNWIIIRNLVYCLNQEWCSLLKIWQQVNGKLS
jgi:hypothetical protein